MKRLTYTLTISLLFILPFTACRNSSPVSSSPDNQNGPDMPRQLDFVSQNITVSDGLNKKTLTIGTGEEATSDFDSGADVESPPFSPPGAFCAHFKNKKYKLLKDIRRNNNKLRWTLEFMPQDGKSITINWGTISDKLNGTLALVDDPNDPKISIDMSEQKSFSSEKGKGGTMYIIYKAYGS